MKKKKFNKKLVLNKESIATLNSSAMNNILGGGSWPVECPSWPANCKTDNMGTCLNTHCIIGTKGCQEC